MKKTSTKRAGGLSAGNLTSTVTDSGSHHHPPRSQTGVQQHSEVTMRNKLISGTKCALSLDQSEQDEINWLPDRVVSAKTGSDIAERIMEKKQRKHMEVVTQFQRDLTELSVKYESLSRDTGEDFLQTLSQWDLEVERLMQKIEHGDLEGFSYQDLHEVWNSLRNESALCRNYIHELYELFIKNETERAEMVTEVLKKHTAKLEEISYLMPVDVRQLMNNEAMMINQALLANRRAVAKLHLNLMEKNLQKEYLCHSRWSTKLQEWKEIKVAAAVNKFKDFMNSPAIQNPKNIQDALSSMQTKQKLYSEQRLKILEQVRNMTPPNCSSSSAAELFSCLSSVNEQIDCMHTETMTKLHEYYEDTWQASFSEVGHFKYEVSTYGFTSAAIEDIVSNEFMPLIGKCQTQAQKRLAEMEKALKALAKSAEFLSKSLFKFVCGAANVWEVHGARLQETEQQLYDDLKEVRKSLEEMYQKKQAQLDVMLDKLRQESTEEALKSAMEEILNFLEEIKKGYVKFYEEGVDIVHRYPVRVLEVTKKYSKALSHYFNVKEIYIQDPEELQILYPSLTLGASQQSSLVNVQNVTPQADSPDLAHPEEFRDSENNETFTTIKGNVYSCPVLQCDDPYEHLNVVEVEAVLYPASLIVEIQRDMREKFFNHLEERNKDVLNHTVVFMEAMKEKLKSELNLRLHLHQPRAKRIEMDVHNVRAAELVLHQDSVDRHCKGILQALADIRTDFNNLQATMQKKNEEFYITISSMEDTLCTATKSDILEKLGASLQLRSDKHMNGILELQRQFRQNIENRFIDLRHVNVLLLKNLKLFSEGGNFTVKEAKSHLKLVQKMDKQVDTSEVVLVDMAATESKYLGQAKEVINKFEEKLHFRKVDLGFLETITRVLLNTQVQLKSEVMKSNTQKNKIHTLTSKLKDKLDAYTQHSLDNQVTTDDIFVLTNFLHKKLRERSRYLDCYLDPSMAIPLPKAPLQGPFAVAARLPSCKQEKVGSPAADSLLQPSCRESDFMDDKAVEVIKGLLSLSKPQTCQEVSEELKETSSTTVTGPVRSSSSSGSGMNPKLSKSHHRKSADLINLESVRSLTKPTRFDKRFQALGLKPDDHQEILTFKGLITNILWKANDYLLQAAEEFYKKKGSRSVNHPQYIQESFELCAEDLNRRLLVYQSQSHEYHHSCVQEFYKQLKTIEEIVCEIPEALLTKLRDQYQENLSQSLTLICQQFEQTWQQSEQKKREHSSQLRVRLSHPACEKELNRLVAAEDDRQEEQRKVIEKNRLHLQACINKNAVEFVTALGTMSETLMLTLDKIFTVADIQGGSAKVKEEFILTHVPQKNLLENINKRQSRVCPVVSYFGTTDVKKQEIATITTPKSTSAQLKVIEFQNALYQSYEQRILKEFAIVEKSRQKLESELLHWQLYWRDELKTLSTLNSE